MDLNIPYSDAVSSKENLIRNLWTALVAAHDNSLDLLTSMYPKCAVKQMDGDWKQNLKSCKDIHKVRAVGKREQRDKQ